MSKSSDTTDTSSIEESRQFVVVAEIHQHSTTIRSSLESSCINPDILSKDDDDDDDGIRQPLEEKSKSTESIYSRCSKDLFETSTSNSDSSTKIDDDIIHTRASKIRRISKNEDYKSMYKSINKPFINFESDEIRVKLVSQAIINSCLLPLTSKATEERFDELIGRKSYPLQVKPSLHQLYEDTKIEIEKENVLIRSLFARRDE